jgi:hypothetical protein
LVENQKVEGRGGKRGDAVVVLEEMRSLEVVGVAKGRVERRVKTLLLACDFRKGGPHSPPLHHCNRKCMIPPLKHKVNIFKPLSKIIQFRLKKGQIKILQYSTSFNSIMKRKLIKRF